MYIYMHRQTYICVFVYIHTSIYIYVYICGHYVGISIYTHTHTNVRSTFKGEIHFIPACLKDKKKGVLHKQRLGSPRSLSAVRHIREENAAENPASPGVGETWSP